jgi:diguanylate cyclase (GGDEF)-like protein/PAS domain S-box-containing protein
MRSAGTIGTPVPAARRSRLVFVLAWAVSVSIALALPVTYFGVSYAALVSALRTKAEVKAEMINELVSHSPDLWRFQGHRLKEILVRFPLEPERDAAQIVDASGAVVAETDDPVAPPAATHAVALHDSGEVVGQVVLRKSLRGILATTALAGLLGLLLAGTVLGTVRVMRARERRAADALFEDQERARVTLHCIGDAVITVDRHEAIEYLNPVAESLTGWTLAEAVGQPLASVLRLIDEDTMDPVQRPMAQALRDGKAGSLATHVSLVRRDGSTVAIDDSAAPIHDRDGKAIGGVLVFHDVTAARSMTQRITWAATHDSLTGLVNRREFESRVDAALASARGSAIAHALCYMDLDQFKIVNDTAGHAAGDALLKQLSLLLLDRLRKSDTLARLGGDEFGVLLEGCPFERAELIAADLLAAVRDMRFSWESKAFAVGVSIGLVPITSESASRTEIFAVADSACYAAKEQGRNRVCTFRRADVELADRRRDMNWAGRIGSALQEDRFVLYYQPYRALAEGGESGNHIEILLRLVDEEGNLVLPGSFIPAAERYNLMPSVDRWVIRASFSRYHELVACLGAPLTCAVNLSGTSLGDDDLAQYIGDQARLHGIGPGAICFEITETAAIGDLRRATRFIKAVKELGFLFALDDFGSGSSSFGYLKNLPVDFLKIDGAFVQDIATDPLDRAMAETINRIGHLMGLKTIGEFAESDGVIEELRAMGVDYAQGFGIQVPRPLPVAGSPN